MERHLKRIVLVSVAMLIFTLIVWSCNKLSNTPALSNQPSKAKLQENQATSPSNTSPLQDIDIVPEEKMQRAPEWTMMDLEGKTHHLSDYLGKVVILDFWDTWCPPCRKEIPGFIELQSKYSERGLVVIGAAFGRDGKEAVKAFSQQNGMNYSVVLTTPQIAQQYGGIHSIPTTFIIDPQGRIRTTHIGYVEKEIFEREILTLLPF